jgi:hypothetical protein
VASFFATGAETKLPIAKHAPRGFVFGWGVVMETINDQVACLITVEGNKHGVCVALQVFVASTSVVFEPMVSNPS